MNSSEATGWTDEFENLREAHLTLAKRLVSADGKRMYKMDILALAVINRSLSISSGFSSVLAQGNLLCAASLVRLQIDSFLRFFASSLVDNHDDFCQKIFEGCPVRKINDKSGKAMTDNYLVGKVSETFPWVEKVYESASGFIHLSEKHIFSAVSLGTKKGSVDIIISDTDAKPDPVFRSELNFVFLDATLLVLQCVGEWVKRKENREHSNDDPLFGTAT